MAIRPMPTPSAEPYTTYSTEKNKKKKETNSGYVTNTVTPPPQPASVVPSAPPVTNNYTQSVPKQNTPSQTKSNLSNTASYNPLSLKQNSTGSQSAMDTIYNKTVTYDAVPTPKTQHGSVKPPVQKTYSYTETKPISKTGTAVKANFTAGKTAYNPYVSKDRVDDPWIESKAGTTKPDWNKLLEINENTDHWGYPKTIKDGAEPKFIPARTPEVNYGINREMVQSVALKPDPAKELYVEYLKRLTENNKGVNREIAQTSFLDHRDQNPVEKFIERNPFDAVQETQFVTKDNVYEQTPEKIKTELSNTGTVVNSEISKLKRQKEDLLFEVQYGRRNSDDPELEKLNYDIEYLQHIEKKIELGLKYQYHFANDELNSLSQADIDDIMNSKEKYGKTLSIYEPYSDALKTINKGHRTYQNSVEVVENIGVECLKEKNGFKIFDKENPQNSFEFSTKLEFNPKGYYEYIIRADKDASKTAEYVQYDLLKVIDGKAVSKSTVDKLVDIAEENGKSAGKLLEFAGYGLDFADFLIVMDSDKEFNKGDVGVDTYKAGGGFLGSVMGDQLGGIAGAKAGAAIGTVAFGPIGTVIGSVIGAAAGAYLLSSAMEELGSYMGEYIYEHQSENSTQQYYQHHERSR